MDNICTNDVQYKWDEIKNQHNIKKHGISFEEAITVFQDTNYLVVYDFLHSINEDRFVALGMSEKMKILYVCHCIRENNVVRIISARKANVAEKEIYEKRFE